MNSKPFIFASIAAAVLFVSWGTDAQWLKDAVGRIEGNFVGDADEANALSEDGASGAKEEDTHARKLINPENYTVNKFKNTVGAIKHMYDKTADLIDGS
ncbi:MAG: hypothetical protein KC466_05900 [Myxococcales bacterium]|nr:hypothetical protein [Myxococcales bacterium]